MKSKLFYLIMMFVCLSFVSCGTTSTVVIDDDTETLYYDYDTNYVIVYRGGLPYYRFWQNNGWYYSLVPRERIGYIRRYYPYNRPHTHTPYHPNRIYNSKYPHHRPFDGTRYDSKYPHHRPSGSGTHDKPHGSGINHRPNGYTRPSGGSHMRPDTRGGRGSGRR